MSDSFTVPAVSNSIPRLGNPFSAWLGRQVLRFYGWRFNGQFPTHKKMIIAVAPHTSNWDFVIGLAVVFALRLKISFFGKHTIFIPPFDRLLRRWGGIPIERSRAHGVVEQISDSLREAEQMVLCLAPEGTRSRVTHWRQGFMHIARRAEVPVVLVGLNYQTRTIELGPSIEVDENIDQAMGKVYQFYAKVQAKFPDKFSYPGETH